MNSGLILIVIGVIVTLLSSPKIRRPLISRLMNEQIITPKQFSPEDSEIVKFAGPNLSIFIIGIVLILIGIIIR